MRIDREEKAIFSKTASTKLGVRLDNQSLKQLLPFQRVHLVNGSFVQVQGRSLHPRNQPRAANVPPPSLPHLWKNLLQGNLEFLGNGNFGMVWMTKSYPRQCMQLQVGTDVLFAGSDGKLYRSQVKRVLSSVFVELQHVKIIDKSLLQFAANRRPVCNLPPGPVVLKSEPYGRHGMYWRDYVKEVYLQRMVPDKHVVTTYSHFPTLHDNSHTGTFWIMQEPMFGGEVGDSLNIQYIAPRRHAGERLGNFMNWLWTGKDALGEADAATRAAFIHEKARLLTSVYLDIIRGVRAVGQSGLVHADLKPENILISSKRCRKDPMLCDAKIADFGVACHKGGQIRSCTGWISGTPAFMAPEVLTRRIHSAHAPQDYWSLGLTLYHVWHNQMPQPLQRALQRQGDITSVIANLNVGQWLEEDMPQELKNAIVVLTQLDPQRRDIIQSEIYLTELYNRMYNPRPPIVPPSRGQAFVFDAPQNPPHLGPILDCVNRGCEYACDLRQANACYCPDEKGKMLNEDGKTCRNKPGAIEKGLTWLWDTFEEWYNREEEESDDEIESEDEGSDEGA